MTNNVPSPKPNEALPVKKAYVPPRLQRFGNIREITQNLPPGSGMNDNAGGGNQKTAP